MTTRPRRILFLGTHGQRNIGDELLLETFLSQLGNGHRYVINTYDKDFTRAQLGRRYAVELIDTTGDRLTLLRQLLRCDLLCFGGGSIIKELYASTGRHRYATMLMILAVVTFAHLVARKPIAMLNIGVGPIATANGRRLARLVLRQVDLLTVRDARSYETCRAIGIPADRVRQTADAVFSDDRRWLLEGPVTPGAVAAPGSDPEDRAAGAPLRVALNLNFHIENPGNWELFVDRLAAGLLEVGSRQPLEIHALPMQSGFKTHDDAEILTAFAARVPGITVHQHRPTTHADVARLLEGCDVVVSERLHAIVISAVLGVPALVLAYDVKVVELAAMLGLDDFTIDINQPFDTAEVVKRLEVLIDRRAEESDRLLVRAAELRAEACASFTAARAWVDGVGRRS